MSDIGEVWLSVPAEVIAGIENYETRDMALVAAEKGARSDGKPRAVIRLQAKVELDPVPPLRVTVFEAARPEGKPALAVASG